MKKIKFFALIIWFLFNLIVGIFLSINLVGIERVNAQDKYKLHVEVSGSGVTNSTGDTWYDAGTSVSVNATADSGWLFSGWLLNGSDVGSDNPYTITMDADHSLTAVFTDISPDITIYSPENVTYSTSSIDLNFTVDEVTSWIGYSLDGETNVTIAEDSTLTDFSVPLSGLSEGPHSIIVYGNDTAGNMGNSGVIYFSVDTTPPTITILSPEEGSISNTKNVLLEFTVDEEVSWMGFSLDGALNETIDGNYTMPGLDKGSHNVVVYANDTANNMGSSVTINFSVQIEEDTIPPVITILSPENVTYSTSSVDLNFTVNEETSWIVYSLDGASNSSEISGNVTLSGLSEGSHNIVVYANDTASNTGVSSTVNFTVQIPVVDTIPPIITITSPQETAYSTSEVALTFTINEPVTWRAYSLDGEANVTINGNTVLSGLIDGEHKIKIFARDNSGNTGVSNIVTFLVDTTPPIISLNSPEETTYSTTNVFLDFTLNEEVTWIGYSLDEQDNVTITADLMLSGLSEGPHSIVVFATDSAGNTGASDLVQFAISIPPVDTTSPIIVITSPESTTYEVSDVPLDFTVNEVTSWIGYSLDGQDNVTITGNIVLSGLSEGSHNVVVFATDSAGNTGASSTVQFTISIPPVDTTSPIIVVTSPENTTYNTNKISLTFTVNEEPSLKSYSLDGKANVTVVDSIVLSNLSDGEHRLIMYAKDLTGNIGASKVIIFTIATENEELTQLWIVGVIGIVASAGFLVSAYITYDLFKSRRTEI